ncbi:hypothetical protein OROMI_001464 [Orobanche minor]
MACSSSFGFDSICVLDGANSGKDISFTIAADTLGKVLAQNNINLIYGGGNTRLVSPVASSAHSGEVNILGVIPKPMAGGNLPGPTIGNELRVAYVQDLTVIMVNNADAFIVLPGGFGTLGELFQIVSWSQLNVHQKTTRLLNVDVFFDGLLSFLDFCVEKNFISQLSR